jgi:hypothetical protein
MTRAEYEALKPGDRIWHVSSNFPDGALCVVLTAFDGEAILLEVPVGSDPVEDEPQRAFFPHECEGAEKIA